MTRISRSRDEIISVYYNEKMPESYLNLRHETKAMHIRVYSKAGDPYSDMLKNILRYHHIEFENLDVSRSPDLFKQLMKESGQTSTPVLVVDGKVYVGFDQHMIKDVLGIPKQQAQ